MDKITIDKLEVFANHGVYPEENVLGQKFVISVVLYTSTRKQVSQMRFPVPSIMEKSVILSRSI